MLPIGVTTTVREGEPLLDAVAEMHASTLDRALVLDGDDVMARSLLMTPIGTSRATRVASHGRISENPQRESL